MRVGMDVDELEGNDSEELGEIVPDDPICSSVSVVISGPART